MALNKTTMYSTFRIFELILMGNRIALNPNTNEILAILDPITFPIEISLFPSKAALILTNNSGADVPKATIVNPMRPWLKPNFNAKDEAPSTKNFPPAKRIIRPKHKTK